MLIANDFLTMYSSAQWNPSSATVNSSLLSEEGRFFRVHFVFLNFSFSFFYQWLIFYTYWRKSTYSSFFNLRIENEMFGSMNLCMTSKLLKKQTFSFTIRANKKYYIAQQSQTSNRLGLLTLQKRYFWQNSVFFVLFDTRY